jgi:hypothetical protein
MTNLLLVDSSVLGYEDITAASNSDTVSIVFDSGIDTYETIKQKISDKGVANYTTVGIVQHGSAANPAYKLVKQSNWAQVSNVEIEDSTLTTWSEVRDFFLFLRATYQTQIIDFISCQLYSNTAWVYIINTLESQTNLKLRASNDNTGNLVNGGNWVQESDNVNIQDIYFTSDIQKFTNLLYSQMWWKRSNMMISGTKPVDGLVTTAGTGAYRKVYNYVGASSANAFTTGFDLTRSYTVASWGTYSTPTPAPTNVLAINSTSASFGVIKSDKSVQAWGNATFGGTTPAVSDVIALQSTQGAFAAVLSNGSITAWGPSNFGGSLGSLGTSANVKAIASTWNAFAAINSNDSITLAWGATGYGGFLGFTLNNMVCLAGNERAFAAVNSSGRLSVWGSDATGGSLALDGSFLVPTSVISGVITGVVGHNSGFSALKNNNTVQSWGALADGGSMTEAHTNISTLTASYGAYAAIKTDGTVEAWGNSSYGGTLGAGINNGVSAIAIAANITSFAVLKSDGTVQAWGDAATGGSVGTVTGVSYLISSAYAFAVLKSNGTVQAWGNPNYGGSVGTVTGTTTSLASTTWAFTAIKSDSSIQCWGNTTNGGITPSLNLVNTVGSTDTAFAALYIGSTKYTYTVISEANKTARFTGYTDAGPSGNIKMMYVSGSTSDATLEYVPSASNYKIIEIGDSAFLNAGAITGFAAPFVTTVGNLAFSGCSSLTYVYIGITGASPTFGTTPFLSCTALSNIFKNINNTEWTSPPAGLTLKTYTPLSVTPIVTLTNATSASLVLSATGGTTQDDIITLTKTYTNTINGIQTFSGLTPIAQSITFGNTYLLTVSNNFETNFDIGNNQLDGITSYTFGGATSFLKIGTY